jgi:hypothetical protein
MTSGAENPVSGLEQNVHYLVHPIEVFGFHEARPQAGHVILIPLHIPANVTE